MAEEGKRISPAVAIIPVGLGLGLLGVLAALAFAAPPKVYTCPYCGAEFDTEGELLDHIELEHPGMPPPEGEAEFAYVSAIRQTTYYRPYTDEIAETVEIDVQNQGDAPGLCTLFIERCLLMEVSGKEHYFDWRSATCFEEGILEATLEPGEVLTFWDNCRRHIDSPRVLWEKIRFNGSPGISDWVYEI